MMMQADLIVIVVVTLFLCNSGAQYPKVPCPDIFQYESSDDLNFGKLALDLGFGVTTLEVELSQTPLSNPAFTEKVDLDIDINDIYNYIEKDKEFPLKVRFQYPNVIPVVTAVRVNGVTICSGPKVPDTLSSRVSFKGTLTVPARNTSGNSTSTIDRSSAHYDLENQQSGQPDSIDSHFFTSSTTSSTAATTISLTSSTASTSTLIPGFLKVLQKATTTISPIRTTNSTRLPPFFKILRRRTNTPTTTTASSLAYDDLQNQPSAKPESIQAPGLSFNTAATTTISPKTTSSTTTTTKPISTSLPGFFKFLQKSKTTMGTTTISPIIFRTSTQLAPPLKILHRRSNIPSTTTVRSLAYDNSENSSSVEPESIPANDPLFIQSSAILSNIPLTATTTISPPTTKITTPTSTSFPDFLKVLKKVRTIASITTISPKTTILPIRNSAALTPNAPTVESSENSLSSEPKSIQAYNSHFSSSASLSNFSSTMTTTTISPKTTAKYGSTSLPRFLKVLQKATTKAATTTELSMSTSAPLSSESESIPGYDPRFLTSSTNFSNSTTTILPTTTSSTTITTSLPGFLKVLQKSTTTAATTTIPPIITITSSTLPPFFKILHRRSSSSTAAAAAQRLAYDDAENTLFSEPQQRQYHQQLH